MLRHVTFMSCRVLSRPVAPCRVVSCRVASCRVTSRRVASHHVMSCHVICSRARHHACRVTFCRVVLSRVTSRLMSCHGEGWQVYDPRTLRGVKAQPAKTRRNKRRGRVANRSAGAKGRAQLLCVPLPYRLYILETSATGSRGYYLVKI